MRAGARIAIALAFASLLAVPILAPVHTATDACIDSVPRSIDGYHTFPEVEAELAGMCAAHPDICLLSSIGQTWEGRDIWVVKVSDHPALNESEPEIFINGGIHAREWIAVEVPLYYLNWLVDGYGSDPQATWLVDNRQIFIAPCVNPDGLAYCQEVGDWRKNRRDNGDGSYGVDLNRNWGGACNGDPDGDWGQGTGVSHYTWDETYCGPAAFSEPETQAMRGLVLAHDFKVTLTYHSYGEEVYWPWGYSTTVQAPHDAVLSAVGEGIAAQSGYTAMQSSFLYETTGDTDDWIYGYSWYGLGKVVSAHTVELGWTFQPPQAEIVPICEANLLSNIFATEASGNIYLDSPDITHAPLPDTFDTMGPYTVSAEITTPNGLLPGATKLAWRNTGGWNEVPMTNTGGSTWEAEIPGQANGTRVRYYVTTEDMNLHSNSTPMYAPYESHTFFVGVDSTPPGPPADLAVQWGGSTSQAVLDEDFQSGIPASWTVADGGAGGDSAATWTTANPGGRSAYSPISEPFAIVDSDEAGTGATQDEQMITSVLDLSDALFVSLEFDQYFYYYSGNEYGDVDVRSSLTGGAWTNVFRNHGSSSPNPDHQALNITTQAAGASDVQVRFYYYSGDYDWYWIVDNIHVTGNSGTTTDDNILTWAPSTDDGAGADDVTKYNIYRSDLQGGPWDVAHLVGTVPAGTGTYQDPGRGELDGINWWYVVRAEDTWGNEDPNALAVPESGVLPDPYGIQLTGRAAYSWVLISFPSGLPGNIQDVLDDATSGDGATTWTVAKWYSAQDTADPWKTYRVGGTANDMPPVSNAMGFWVWLTGNGGDETLSLSSYAATPDSTVINLYAGWNLVGYPSATAATGATLPPEVDALSVYSGSAAYTDYHGAAMDAVPMTHGNAYFLHSTSDATWTVTGP